MGEAAVAAGLHEAVAALERELTCTLCERAYVNPVLLPCAHAFCKDCVEDTSECQACFVPFLARDAVPSPTLRSVLQEFVACKRRITAALAGEHADNSRDLTSSPAVRERYFRAFCEVERKMAACQRLLRDERAETTSRHQPTRAQALDVVAEALAPCDDAACAIGCAQRAAVDPPGPAAHGPATCGKRARDARVAGAGGEGGEASAAEQGDAPRSVLADGNAMPPKAGAKRARPSSPPVTSRAAGVGEREEGGDADAVAARALGGAAPASAPTAPSVLIVGSNLTEASSAALKRACRELGGAQALPKWAPAATHVIIDPTVVGGKTLGARTYKHLCGVLTGGWILSTAWVSESLSAGRWLPEASFELDGDVTTEGAGGPAKGRARRAAGRPGPFVGVRAYLQGKFATPLPPKAQLTQLLQLGGAQIFPTFAQLQDSVVRRGAEGAIALCTPNSLEAAFEQRCRSAGVPVLTPQWLLDCISHCDRLSYAGPTSGYLVGGAGAGQA